MKKKFVALTALVLSASLFLVACGSGTADTTTTAGETTTEAAEETTSGEETEAEETTTEAEETTPEETDAEAEPVEITLIQSKTEIQEDLQTVVDDYNANNPDNATITLLGTTGDNYGTTLQSQFSADPANAPTIFTAGGVDGQQFMDFMAPLDDLEAAGLLGAGFIEENSNEAGELVGLPMAVEGYGFIYNVGMFEDAGIDAASLTDIDSFVAALETLAAVEGVDAPIGFSMETYFIFVHFFNWGTALDPDYSENLAAVGSGDKTFADIPSVAAWGEALDKIAPYTNKGLVSYDEQVAGFGAGQYAMIHQGVWAQQVLDQNEVDFEYAFLNYPLEGNGAMPVGAATSWRVNSKATEAQQQAAKNFIDWFISSPEGQEYSANTLNLIPPYEGALAPTGNLTEQVAAESAAGNTIPWVFNTDYPAGIDVDGARLMEQFYAGDIDAAQLLEELSTVWADLS